MSAPRVTDLSVVDLGVGMAPALVAQMLGRFGASLKRVEPPGGDPFKAVYPADPFWRKAEVVIPAADLDAALADADVLILGGESWPGFEWKHDADAISKRFPNLVVLEIEGYASGDAKDRPAVDLLVQARTGAVYEQYRQRASIYAIPIGSYGAAVMGLIGVQAALLARRREGKGQVVRTSLQEGVASWMEGSWSTADKADPGFLAGTPRDAQSPTYRCRDGKYIALSLGIPGSVAGAYRALEIDLPVDPKERGLPDNSRGLRDYFHVRDIFEPAFAKFDRDDALKRLWAQKLPANPALEPGECWTDEQVTANDLVDWDPRGLSGAGNPFGVVAPDYLGARAASVAPSRWDKARAGGRPLEGVRILDLGAWVAGPFAGKLLADLGADVIKVEPPEGDPVRVMYRIFASCTRGKKCIAVDLKNPDGLALIRRLAKDADVIMHNMRVGVDKRLGIDAQSLRAANPNLVYLHSSAFGQKGPQATNSGFDPVTQPFSGHSIRAGGQGNDPIVHHIPVLDYGTGALGAVGILQGLLQVAAGKPADMDASLLSAGLYFMSELVKTADGEFKGAPVLNRTQTGFHPAESLYQAKDGWLGIAARTDAMAATLAEMLGLKLGPRGRWGDAEQEAIAAAILKLPVDKLLADLDAAGVWAEPCLDDGQLNMSNAAAKAVGLVVAGPDAKYGEVRAIGPLVRFSASKIDPAYLEFPAIGENTRAVLEDFGVPAAEIERLFADKVVA